MVGKLRYLNRGRGISSFDLQLSKLKTLQVPNRFLTPSEIMICVLTLSVTLGKCHGNIFAIELTAIHGSLGFFGVFLIFIP